MARLDPISVVVILVFLVVLSLFVDTHLVVAASGPELNPVQREIAPGVYLEILPRMELLAGVQSQTDWIDNHGPRGQGNVYFRELQTFFQPYSGSRAVKLSQQLNHSGFSYDAPPHFVLRLGPLPELGQAHPYGEYLEGRADRESLEAFRLALKDVAAEADFDTFFDNHRDDYAAYINAVAEGFDAQSIIGWMREFFGMEGGEYHMVLAPAMFPGGGYGASIPLDNGKDAIYEVLREAGTSSGEPTFGDASTVQWLALHEWGHSFVNPSLGQYPDKVSALKPLYEPVAGQMTKQAYPSVDIFLNEQVLRASTALALADLQGTEASEKMIADDTRRGFYLTRYTVEKLEYYRDHRDQFPDFGSFAGYLLDQYAANMDSLVRRAPRPQWQLWLLVFTVVLALGLSWRSLYGRRRSSGDE